MLMNADAPDATRLVSWWSLVLRGLAAISFGLVSLLAPGISLSTLVLLFGAYALVDGLLALVAAARRVGSGRRWSILAFEGVVGVAVGIAALAVPVLTLLALIFMIGSWAVVTGIVEILAAVRLRRVIRGEWLLALCGVLSVAFGALLWFVPLAGAVALMTWIGAYALVFGALLIALGVRTRSWQRGPSRSLTPAHS